MPNDTPILDDTELLRRFRAERSPEAFRTLVDRYCPAVLAAATRILRATSPPLDHLTEDVAQSVFILLAQKTAKIPANAPLIGWLYKVTHYACANLQRRERVRRRHEKESAVMRPIASPVGDRVSDAEVHLDRALLALSAHDRDILLLRYTANHSLSNIARITRLPPETAKKRLARAIERLRKNFAAQGLAATAVLSAMTPASPVSAALTTKITAAALAPTGATTSILIAQGVAHMMKVAAVSKFATAAAVVVASVLTFTLILHSFAAAPRAPVPPGPATAAASAPATAPSPWGTVSGAVKTRLVAKSVIEQNDVVSATLQLESVPQDGQIGNGIDSVNVFNYQKRMSLQLRDINTGKTYLVTPPDPNMGMPPGNDDGSHILNLFSKAIPALEVAFPLRQKKVPPGEYDATVTYTSSPLSKGANFFTGKVQSGAVHITIAPETLKPFTFTVPKQLALDPDGKIRFHTAGGDKIDTKLGNGLTLGTSIAANGNPSSLQGGILRDDEILADWKLVPPKDPQVAYTIEIFATPSAPEHGWDPGTRQDGYVTLWKKTFVVTVPK